MAEDTIPQEVEDNIERSLGNTGGKKAKKRVPVYQMVGDSKVPVSLSYGKIWASRKSAALKATESSREGWSEAIRYYEHDQMPHRHSDRDGSGNVVGNQRLNNNITETENVVFANVTTMVPALYARNPTVEMTTEKEELKEFNVAIEHVVNAVMNRKTTPGVNLKNKAKRAVVSAALCNRGYVEIGWTTREASSEQAINDLTDLSKKLEKAKSTKDIELIEGKLEAIDKTIDILEPAGPFTKYRKPHDILIDPEAKEPDLSDANWVMTFEFIPTDFILAQYATKKGDEFKSIYKPTHVMKVGKQEDPNQEEQHNFSLFEDEEDSNAKAFGFDSDEAFNKAKMTRVAMVWDKRTRRVLMYNDSDWTWPIWVWDDPLQLDEFYPIYPLWFYEGLDNNRIKGEVTYYLDQQDAINEMVDEERRARLWARRNIFFDLNSIKDEDAQAILKGPDGTARGIRLPEGMKLGDVIGSIPPPGLNFTELFDKESKYRAIDRISSVGEVLRGTQFKTNTTNDAVNANVSSQNMRIDEKSDQIEDWIGRIGWGLAQLCLINMDKEMVQMLTNDVMAERWQNFQPKEIKSFFNMKVVGGSGKKPTSQAKKQEAIELGQVLGQFANASPTVVIIMLRMMQEAFDEIVIGEEDWQQILDSITQQQQQSQQGTAPPQGAAQPPQQGQSNGAAPGGIDEVLARMPPEIKAQVVQAIQSGMDPQQAIQQAVQQIQ
jgi:hypothetical protein